MSFDATSIPRLDPEVKQQLSKIATTIRVLSMDAVQKASSGHPGLPLGCAELGAYLFGFLLKHNPKNPSWMNRDRLILSAGHGSMWLYSGMFLSGFDLSLDDIKHFRQLYSKTPGHPESFMTPGVETTTGPLGQGFGNAVGTALGLKILAKKFNTDEFKLFSSKVFVLASDGCMMEGVNHETAALAGHLGLDNLVVYYDSNDVSLDGPLSESASEDTKARYRAYGWDVFEVNGHDFDQIDRASRQALYHQKKPVLVIIKTLIGKGAPTKAGSHTVHGAPLGEEEIKLAKKALGVSEEPFYVPPAVTSFFKEKLEQDILSEKEWQGLFENWARSYPDKKAEFDSMLKESFSKELEEKLVNLPIKGPLSGRKASQEVLDFLFSEFPSMYSGSADLSSSDLTMVKKFSVISKDHMNGRNIKFGVREFAMGTMATGLSQTRMIIPVVGTFLVFSDYMKSAIRLAAMMQQKLIYQFTHDSIFLGEDGPTHQPIEQLAGLRAIPNLQVIRPSGIHEVKMSWFSALMYKGPTALVLSRQTVKEVPETILPYSEGFGKGAYIIKKEKSPCDYTLVATGSELPLAMDVAASLETIGKSVRVVSMPCWSLFEQQSPAYKESLFGKGSGKKVSIEAASEMGWHKYIGQDGIAIAVESFGASAPQSELAYEYGFTVEEILNRLL